MRVQDTTCLVASFGDVLQHKADVVVDVWLSGRRLIRAIMKVMQRACVQIRQRRSCAEQAL